MRALAVLVAFGLVACQQTPDTTTRAPTPATSDAYTQGLEVWRKPLIGAKFNTAGVSCSSCHGADMVDLAVAGVRDADISRRGLEDGLSPAEVARVVAAVKDVRVSLKLQAQDPDTFRPFQPGGVLLPGADNTERDIAFGRTLAAVVPTLMRAAPITTLQDAQKARDELLAINLRDLKVGIPMPRLSEDRFHNAARDVAPQDDHGTLNDWIADVPRVHDGAWFALQDAYLADPTPERFWRLYAAAPSSTAAFPNTGTRAVSYGLTKYKSALIGQHLMRAKALEDAGRGRFYSDFMAGNPSLPNANASRHVPWAYLDQGAYRSLFDKRETNATRDNPNHPLNDLWDVGDAMRETMESQEGTAAERLLKNGFPKFVAEGVSPLHSDFTMKQNMAASWFWLSFTMDASLRGAGNFAAQGHYFAKTMNSVLNLDLRDYSFPGGAYFIHGTFMHALRFAVQGFVPESGSPDAAGKYPTPDLDLPGMKDFWMPNEDQKIVLSSAEPLEQRQLFGRFVGNSLLMMVALYEEALNDGRARPYPDYAQVAFRKRFDTMVGCVRLGLEAYRPDTVAGTMARFEAMRVKLGGMGARLPKLQSYPCDAYYP
jgi:hypothetical protein